MILVIIILVAWMIILGPNLLKRRSRTTGGINSISHFHRQLRILEQSGPQQLVTPAFRLRSVDGSPLSPDGGEGSGVPVAPKLSVVGADQLPRPALAFLGRDPSGPDAGSTDKAVTGTGYFPVADPGTTDPDPVAASARPPDAYARHRARRRRRDTLGVLTLFFATTVLIGFIPGASVAWVLSLVSGLALAGYVALLVRMRQMAEERERKLHYLRPDAGQRNHEDTGTGYPEHRRDGLHGVSDLPARVSGRYAHPPNQAAMAR